MQTKEKLFIYNFDKQVQEFISEFVGFSGLIIYDGKLDEIESAE